MRARLGLVVGIVGVLVHAVEPTGSFEAYDRIGGSPAWRACASISLKEKDDSMLARSMFVSLWVCATGSFANGAELLVPEHFPSIQSAIAGAQAGDVVSVAPGVYFESLNTLGKAITVAARVSQTVELIPPSTGRSLTVATGEGSATEIRGVLFRGRKGYGGGVLVQGASPRLVLCGFDRVRNPTGGAVQLEGGNCSIEHCTFANCIADAQTGGFGSGGAIRSTAGAPSVADSTFLQNAGPTNADAIMNEGSSRMLIIRCDFGPHLSKSSILYNSDAAVMRIEDCSFHDDASGRAAIVFAWGARQIVNCTFERLVTLGAVVQSSSGHTEITGCHFRNCASTQLPASGVARSTGSATFTIGETTFCGMSPAAIGVPYEDRGGNIIEATCTIPCPPDLVADTVVNAADMAIVLNFWGTDGSQFPGVDIDGDGIVNGADLAAVLNAWGPCPQ
jgi:hypothetical protein